MEFTKPEKNVSGFLTLLFRELLDVTGIKHNLVREMALKKVLLSEKDFNSLKRLMKDGGISFKSFVWLIGVMMGAKHISVRVTVTDKNNKVSEATVSTVLDSSLIQKE